MFTRKKPEPPKRRNHNLSQFGLMEISNDGYDDNDSDLEAELAAISGGGGPAKRNLKPKPEIIAAAELDRMVAASLQDMGSDDEADIGDDDADLLGELQSIVEPNILTLEETTPEPAARSNGPPTAPQQLQLPTTTLDTEGVIRQRIEMYKQAEATAISAGEGAKARRIKRGLKTLIDLLKQASAGETINVDDIPPEVSLRPAATAANAVADTPTSEGSPKVATQAPAPEAQEPSLDNKNPSIDQMRSRQHDYKMAALQFKHDGDTTTALQFLKVVKQFDMVIKMCVDGQAVDLTDMPPPPEQFLEFLASMQAAAEAPAGVHPVEPTSAPSEPAALTVEATNMLDALQQRLEKYRAVEQVAKAEDNASKARRFGRIVKQYEDAVKAYKAGQSVAYDELPIPPGFGPLPTGNVAPSKSISNSPSPTVPAAAAKDATTPANSPTARKKPAPTPPSQHTELTTRTTGNQQKNNLAEEQMRILLERQKEFKIAALQAKKADEIEQAKEYLKIYKGFDSLLNAASSGLPVDLSTLPLPPSQKENLEASFAIVSSDDVDPDDDISDIGVRVEEQLAKQLMMCKNTRDHHKAMGDVAGMNRFENLAVTVQKDLDLVRYSKRKNFPLPKFHYENRSFNIVHCNTDLSDSELEIMVVRGLSYKVAKDVDTYVRIEFPLLNDEVYKTKTTVIRDSDSPDYEQRFTVEIQRKNRQFQRIFKRHGVKFEVYSRGGFLRSDTLIGTINVKLQPLETKCDIHDTFDLMDGRRAAGGKLEVKIRVRNPIMTKQMEHINEKWLVLDS